MSDFDQASRSADPPELRVSQEADRRCDACMYFATTGRGNRELDGRCSAYEAFVRGDFACASFLSIYPEPRTRISRDGYGRTEPPGTEEPTDESGQQGLC